MNRTNRYLFCIDALALGTAAFLTIRAENVPERMQAAGFAVTYLCAWLWLAGRIVFFTYRRSTYLLSTAKGPLGKAEAYLLRFGVVFILLIATAAAAAFLL